MIDRKHRTRLPLTSRVWFFPTLILLMPLVSRACMNTFASPPGQRRAAYNEQACMKQYDECVQACPGEPDDGLITEAEQSCIDFCYEEYELCLAGQGSDSPTCDPDLGYCGYDDYGDSSSDWSCDASDDDYYDDSSSDWSCSSSDSSDYSDDSSAWDCSADNSDEGDSGGDWGEDWGERSPAGGDGIDSPLDLPPG